MANIQGVYDKKKSEDGGSDDEDKNKFYVGGADGRGGGSGLNVIDPADANDDPYAGIKSNAAAAADGEAVGAEDRRIITLYSNGFTVGDGPFRALSDPENAAFVEAMNKGVVPEELQAGGTDVNVSVVNKMKEEYTAPPPPAYVAYSGGGASLGESVVSEGAVVTASDTAEVPIVDESKPKTTIAVRLVTGKRMKATLNLDHTVAHLQALIQLEGAGNDPYLLMAGFPPAQLTDSSLTIEAAGLKGSQVIQKKC